MDYCMVGEEDVLSLVVLSLQVVLVQLMFELEQTVVAQLELVVLVVVLIVVEEDSVFDQLELIEYSDTD